MRHLDLATVDSTSAEIERRIAAGAIDGWTLLTAGEQTAGRGRLGRRWASPPGNLFASFAVPRGTAGEWRRPWLLGMVAALALAEAVEPLVEDAAPVSLKWPNDVLVGGGKLAGILLEGAADPRFLVLGIGVNLAWAPADTPYPATSLAAHRARPVDRLDFAGRLAERLQEGTRDWIAGGFPAVRPHLLARMHAPGHRLQVRVGENVVHGCFAGLDPDGFLLLETAAGTRRFSAGDVFPGLG